MDEVAGMTPSALLDALFANPRLGLAAWDRDLRYVRVNDVLAAMNGIGPDEHVGRRVPEVLPDLGPRLEGLMRRLIETGEPLHDVEIAGETPAAPGVERHWLASYFPVLSEDGEVAGVSATVVEVTGERRANEREQAALRRTESVDAQLRAVYAALPV